MREWKEDNNVKPFLACHNARLLRLIALPLLLLASVAYLASQTLDRRASLANVLKALEQPFTPFEQNVGQEDPTVQFLLRAPDYSIFLTSRDAVMVGSDGARLTMNIPDAQATVEGSDPLAGSANYFLGNDFSRWLLDIPTFEGVRYRNVYPGVDLVYKHGAGPLMAELQIAQSADIQAIRWQFAGARQLKVSQTGDLILTVGSGEFQVSAPRVIEHAGRDRRSVKGAWVIERDDQVWLRMESRNNGGSLDVEFALSCAFCLANSDSSAAVNVDTSSAPYVAGHVDLTPYSPGKATTRKAIVLRKFGAIAKESSYVAYIGGVGRDVATALTVDQDGYVYMVGHTSSGDFPSTRGAWQPTLAGRRNAFVTKLSPDGGSLVYSTFLGAESNDLAYGVAVNHLGNAFVTGYTDSHNFPVTITGGRARTSDGDVFVTKLSKAGDGLVYSTTVGGNSIETGRGIATDASGNAFIAGFTLSDDFPTTTDAIQVKRVHGSDAFLFALDPEGEALNFSSYLGGDDTDEATSVAIDENGKVHIAGFTRSRNFPVTEQSVGPNSGNSAGFVSILDPAIRRISKAVYSGEPNAEILALLHDSDGRVFAVGLRDASNGTASPIRSIPYSAKHPFVTEIDAVPSQPQHGEPSTVDLQPNASSASYTSLGANGNYGCPIPLVAQTSDADCDTALLADPSDSMPLGNRTPLILIHGIHGNATDVTTCGIFSCSTTKLDDATGFFESHYFDNLISFLSALSSQYKIYRFHYVSDRYRVYVLAQSLRNRLDRLRRDDPNFLGKKYVIVAHSMGGLIARSYMNEHNNDYGPKAGQRGGESVIKLITLATPHQGSPGANGTLLRRHGDASDNEEWNTALNKADSVFWNDEYHCGPCQTDPTHVNRRDLRWARYTIANDIFADVPNLYALNSAERNDDLIDLPPCQY
jgi:pimeloyl-ACP methyl ester carboxylesterase